MCSAAGDTTQLVPGSPIRTPWDHSSVDSSPRPIAASHVLHRLLVPRHPPCALSNLTTTKQRLPTHPRQRVNEPGERCSHPLCNSQQTRTTTNTPHNNHPPAPK